MKSSEDKDDIVQEDIDDSVVAEEALADTVKNLRTKLKECEKERKEYLDGWQRAKADLVNARKRDEEERKEFIKLSNERLIEELIPALESFGMAFANKEAWEKVDKNWRMGVEYIYSQLKKALEENGLAEINPVGKKFDPSRDEASEYVPVDDEKQDHIVISVVQKGYTLNGKVLRPPKVKVGEWRK
jgi:molecular chaperone GrpE